MLQANFRYRVFYMHDATVSQDTCYYFKIEATSKYAKLVRCIFFREHKCITRVYYNSLKHRIH